MRYGKSYECAYYWFGNNSFWKNIIKNMTKKNAVIVFIQIIQYH